MVFLCQVTYVKEFWNMLYRIAKKFGGENVWQIYSFQAFGGEKIGESIDQPKGYSIKLLIWMVLVWRIVDDSPNSPNFLPAKLPAIQYVLVKVAQ